MLGYHVWSCLKGGMVCPVLGLGAADAFAMFFVLWQEETYFGGVGASVAQGPQTLSDRPNSSHRKLHSRHPNREIWLCPSRNQ